MTVAAIFLETSLQIHRILANRPEQKQLETHIYQLAPTLHTSTYVFMEVLRDPRAALGQNACWSLGDVMISLQVPPNMRLWTRDPDFGPLATALGIALYTPPTNDNTIQEIAS